MLHGPANHRWKGDEVGYYALHCWVAANFEKTGVCERCGGGALTEWASIGHTYTDGSRLCRTCARDYARAHRV